GAGARPVGAALQRVLDARLRRCQLAGGRAGAQARSKLLKIKAIYPGTFDPIHFGHEDIIRRAASLFDELLVAVYDKPLKTLLFSPEQRVAMVRAAGAQTGRANISVVGYSGLTVDFCHSVQARVMVRGLRVFSDFEH